VIPEADTEALDHQIAGHARTGVLKHRLGYVLKSVQKPPLGPREMEFYGRVYDSHGSDEPGIHSLLREWIPKFYGVTCIESKKEDGGVERKEYLVLDDIAQGFKKPCIVDVKMGVKTWDPLATEAKIEHEKKKYIGTKEPLGISVTGMQFYDMTEQRAVKLDKEFGKHLNVDNIYQAFEEFFNRKAGIHRTIAAKLVEKLIPLNKLFDAQRYYSFYSSSLLIVYDADRINKLSNGEVNGTHYQHPVNDDDWLRVKMIDFAHVFPSEGKLDDNYIFGLDNLIRIFSAIAGNNFV
jgi:1D-myo-inositol-tetrakisphosphate 5-kinase/inositol-polyphosphate multikinase